MIRKWTGHESRVLRQAMRLSQRDFANDLGISAKSVATWEAGGSRFVQRPESQAILDTKLSQVSDEVRARFKLILSDETEAAETERNATIAVQTERPAESPIRVAPNLSRPENLPDSLGSSFVSDMSDADAVKRRAFLASVAVVGFGAVNGTSARETIRHEISRPLNAQSATTNVEEWRQIITEYGESYPATQPAELLKMLMVDLYSLQDAMHSNSREADQRALRGVCAMLSAFTAQTIANLGNLHESRRWWRTAREAADESEDSYAILWIRGREIILAGYEQRPLSSILRLISELEARITERSPARPRMQFLSGKAQTLALMGQPAADEAEKTLNRLRSSFDSVPNVAPTTTNMITTCAEEHLYFTESLTYTYLGEFRKADRAQSAALRIYPGYRLRPRAEIELQRALCLIDAGEMQSGIQHAQGTIARLPVMYRTTTVADLGQKVLSAVPTRERSNVNVKDYAEFLNTAITVAPELTA